MNRNLIKKLNYIIIILFYVNGENTIRMTFFEHTIIN